MLYDSNFYNTDIYIQHKSERHTTNNCRLYSITVDVISLQNLANDITDSWSVRLATQNATMTLWLPMDVHVLGTWSYQLVADYSCRQRGRVDRIQPYMQVKTMPTLVEQHDSFEYNPKANADYATLVWCDDRIAVCWYLNEQQRFWQSATSSLRRCIH